MYYAARNIYGNSGMLSDGRGADIWLLGQLIYTVDLITITMKAAFTVATWVKFTFMAIFGSIALWLVFFPIYATILPPTGLSPELNGLVPMMFDSGAFWFGILIIPFIANYRDFIWKL